MVGKREKPRSKASGEREQIPTMVPLGNQQAKTKSKEKERKRKLHLSKNFTKRMCIVVWY